MIKSEEDSKLSYHVSCSRHQMNPNKNKIDDSQAILSIQFTLARDGAEHDRVDDVSERMSRFILQALDELCQEILPPLNEKGEN